jgi:hypothetical protein
MGGLGIEEGESLGGRGDAARQQKLGEGWGDSGFAGEDS